MPISAVGRTSLDDEVVRQLRQPMDGTLERMKRWKDGLQTFEEGVVLKVLLMP